MRSHELMNGADPTPLRVAFQDRNVAGACQCFAVENCGEKSRLFAITQVQVHREEDARKRGNRADARNKEMVGVGMARDVSQVAFSELWCPVKHVLERATHLIGGVADAMRKNRNSKHEACHNRTDREGDHRAPHRRRRLVSMVTRFLRRFQFTVERQEVARKV